MKIALVHDYLTQRGGAERVFELLCHYFPEADIFTSLYDPQRTIDLSDRVVNTTVLQKIPGAAKNFRLLAPFYYPAFRMLDLQEYDLILSSSSSFAKSVRKRPGAKHICFCHNVTRFVWDTDTYLKNYSQYKLIYPAIAKLLKSMVRVDRQYAQEPDLYIANSGVVSRRIQKAYGRRALVAHYPIDSQKFKFSDRKEDFYLVTSRLLGYKRIDVTIRAFNELGWPLIIIGNGPERKYLESIASDNVQFLGYVSDTQRCLLMSKARAVVISALEDYGLVPIEANASGTPVIGYGAGGILETQVPDQTGILFEEQTPASLKAALLESRKRDWDFHAIRDRALGNFSESIFFQKVERIATHVSTPSMVDLRHPELAMVPN
ncbi:glycosyltransferase [Oscillatoriales cyanobacterium LEGE 11467]|uniref:Glycosyltransferase n=1 Tax=Zarconia navalis LEGE 11467 TaxID=1828826 RepID=A0A928VYS1_9CYAN|nr:glycosyltransferase [Zarconia navalis]MBE9042769.1 glycosyltransferase [Zarconia navalis LEGE 11467]